MLRNMKKQFAGLLKDIGFINNSDPKHDEANYNSSKRYAQELIHIYSTVAISFGSTNTHTCMITAVEAFVL